MVEAIFVYLEITRRDGAKHLIGQLLEDVWALLDELKQGGALQTTGPFCRNSSAATPGINTTRLRRPTRRHDAHGDLHDNDDDIESDGHFMIGHFPIDQQSRWGWAGVIGLHAQQTAAVRQPGNIFQPGA